MPLLIFFTLFFSLFSADIYRIYIDESGNCFPGEPLLTVLENEDAPGILAEYLDLEEYHVRREGQISYVSPISGTGYIPVLSFHKLGDKDNFELQKERFEELLIYLNENSFYVIRDLQYIEEDYTHVPNGHKIVVMGSDDGSKGVFYYKTEGDLKTGNIPMKNGEFLISDESMVYYLDKYLEKEMGKGNFTFYLTFDAIPFRQTGGEYNPGTPYLGMNVVKSKLDYLSTNYYLGNHTQNHLYSEDLSELEFIRELNGFYRVLESYEINIKSIETMAYSFGIGELSEEREETLDFYNYKGTYIKGAFDYNGYFASPLNQKKDNPLDVSRIGVDNKSYSKIMTLLENVDIFRSGRVVLVHSEQYPFDLSSLNLNRDDLNYILIGN